VGELYSPDWGAGTDDFYLGCGLENLPGGEWLSVKTGIPLLWTEPLKFLTSAPRLVLLRAIEKKILTRLNLKGFRHFSEILARSRKKLL